MEKYTISRATNCTMPQDVVVLLENALSTNTRRAYQADIASFVAWGGTIPSTPEEITSYIAASVHILSVLTIRRHLSALSFAHETLEQSENPVRQAMVRTAMKGAARLYGTRQKGMEPLLLADLRRIIECTGDSTIDVRKKALLALGFAGGFRRSELVGLNCEDIVEKPEGLIVTIRKSKTDQEGQGRLVGIPFGRGRICPATLTLDWLSNIRDQEGPLFRSVRRGGLVRDQRLSGEAVAKVIKQAVCTLGLDPANYSAHSLRAGFVTSAIQAGAPSQFVRKQTGHASEATMARYVRLGSLFTDNAVSWML